MKYQTRSIIVGRKAREKEEDEDYPCFIHMFDVDNPHRTSLVPKKMIDFPHIHKVVMKGLDINYLLAGNDIVVNNLSEVDIEEHEGHVHITGTQEAEE